MDEQDQVVLAKILIELYQPWLLVMEVSCRFISQPTDYSVEADMAWVRYKDGQRSLEGWLIDHSLLYRLSLYWGESDEARTLLNSYVDSASLTTPNMAWVPYLGW